MQREGDLLCRQMGILIRVLSCHWEGVFLPPACDSFLTVSTSPAPQSIIPNRPLSAYQNLWRKSYVPEGYPKGLTSVIPLGTLNIPDICPSVITPHAWTTAFWLDGIAASELSFAFFFWLTLKGIIRNILMQVMSPTKVLVRALLICFWNCETHCSVVIERAYSGSSL